MKENGNDITQTLISESELFNNLTSIFVDSIILRKDFQITAISESILDALGYTLDEVRGQSINILSTTDTLQEKLIDDLGKGFFDQVTISFKSKKLGTVYFRISGFYLGLISDLNGFIVLTVKDINEINRLNTQLDQSRKELDEFIYRSGHDLRGPLATIRGLANVMKMEKSIDGMSRLVEALDKHAEKLDDRLFNLIYLAESDKATDTSGKLDCYTLETSLRSTLETTMHKDQIHFDFKHSTNSILNVHDQLVLSMLNNLLLYLMGLPKSQINEIEFSVTELTNGVQFDIHSKGFKGADDIKRAVNKSASLYTNMLTYSNLINYYAAQKVSRKLNAVIRIDFIQEDDQYISIFVPFNSTPSLQQ